MKMEVGSFIELDLRTTGEFHHGTRDIARLNSARAGIYHACRLLKCSALHAPYYLCPSVKKFLSGYNICVEPYYINKEFKPESLTQKADHAVLIVNHFGILSSRIIRMLTNRYKNVIIDNSAAFYARPLDGVYNVYSSRKFFGVPDGCYVIGKDAYNLTSEYKQDFSSDTAAFLFKRIEYGSSAVYSERMKNEERIDRSGIKKMSCLTHSLLNSIDYQSIRKVRKHNFQVAHSLFRSINRIDPTVFLDRECIPMVYPLVIEQSELLDKLLANQIYTGRLWNQVLSEVPENTFEAWMSKFMLPVPIDQRYNKQVLQHIHDVVTSNGFKTR